MTDKQEIMLAYFERKMRQLMDLCDLLKERNQALRIELEQKNLLIDSLNAEVIQLKTEFDNLKFAKALETGNSHDVQDAKLRLSRLVKDVDKCIALLKI